MNIVVSFADLFDVSLLFCCKALSRPRHHSLTIHAHETASMPHCKSNHQQELFALLWFSV